MFKMLKRQRVKIIIIIINLEPSHIVIVIVGGSLSFNRGGLDLRCNDLESSKPIQSGLQMFDK